MLLDPQGEDSVGIEACRWKIMRHLRHTRAAQRAHGRWKVYAGMGNVENGLSLQMKGFGTLHNDRDQGATACFKSCFHCRVILALIE